MKKLIGNLLIVLVSFAFLLVACQNGGGTQDNNKTAAIDTVSALKNRVMAVHDTAMAKMGTMVKLKKQINIIADSISQASGDTNLVKMAKQYTKRLDFADSSMMRWMREYEDPSTKDMNEADALKYLQVEYIKVEKVAANIDQAIGTSREFIMKVQERYKSSKKTAK